MVFKKNENIVRDDGRYPDDALIVDGYDAQGNLLTHPLGGGFQIIISPAEHSRFDTVSVDERTPLFIRVRFSLEGCHETFAGWTDGTRWNGWAKPRFDFSVAQLIITALGKDVAAYESTTDTFITTIDPAAPESWPAEQIHLPDGGTTKVYAIGAGSWTWEEES